MQDRALDHALEAGGGLRIGFVRGLELLVFLVELAADHFAQLDKRRGKLESWDYGEAWADLGASFYGHASSDRMSFALRSLTYPDLLTLRPPAPERFTLEFELGTSQLTAASQARLDAVMASAQARAGGEIVVTGHTDRQGSVQANDQLSLQRAQAVRALLIERGFKANLIEAVGRGERAPLVPTEDEVAEPRNRRAELLVR